MFDSDENIFDLTESRKSDKHRTISGNFVEFFSPECKEDLLTRIDDAIHTRDETNCRSDERIHYNGVLNVLRRKLREVEKEMSLRQIDAAQVKLQERRDRSQAKANGESSDSRILKLAGIL